MSEFRWSYSKRAAFQACPHKFKLQYIDQAAPDGPPDSNLAFGSALHSALNAALTGGDPQAVFEIYWNSYQDKEIDYGRLSWAALAELGTGFIRKFVKSYANRFEVVEHEKRLEGEYGGIQFEGTLDLLAKFDGVLTLVDFKTTSAPYDKAKARASFQLFLYSHLCQKQLGVLPAQTMYLPFVKSSGSIQTPIIHPLDEKEMREAMDNFVAGVPKETHYHKNYDSCFAYNRRCEFFNRCHAQKETENE